MNNSRRKDISDIKEKIEEQLERLQICLDEEQEYIDNMPENLQESEKYEAAEEATGVMESVKEGIESELENLEEALN